MTSAHITHRFERKFLPDGLSPAEVLARVRRHPALFREIYPERPVNNLYYDSPDLRHYFDHVHGMANRVKIRVRWYGAFLAQVERPVLEFKTRQGLVGDKVSYALPALDLRGDLAHRRFEGAFDRGGLPEGVRFQLRGVEPLLANRYRRRYFCSGDGRVRLTMDWGLELWDARQRGGSTRRLPAASPPVILELKYDPKHTEEATFITNALPFRLTRCSKYILGIESLQGA